MRHIESEISIISHGNNTCVRLSLIYNFVTYMWSQVLIASSVVGEGTGGSLSLLPSLALSPSPPPPPPPHCISGTKLECITINCMHGGGGGGGGGQYCSLNSNYLSSTQS